MLRDFSPDSTSLSLIHLSSRLGLYHTDTISQYMTKNYNTVDTLIKNLTKILYISVCHVGSVVLAEQQQGEQISKSDKFIKT